MKYGHQKKKNLTRGIVVYVPKQMATVHHKQVSKAGIEI
jgi:hypothetical protein